MEGVKTYDPSYMFAGVKTSHPQDLRPCRHHLWRTETM